MTGARILSGSGVGRARQFVIGVGVARRLFQSRL
jgi:hypothetical protein